MSAFTPITADWVSDPRAQCALASCAANPPRVAAIPAHERWTRDDWSYVGFRVEVLRAIWNELGERVLEACQLTNEFSAWERFCAGPSVQDAIVAAVEAAAVADEAIAAARGVAA